MYLKLRLVVCMAALSTLGACAVVGPNFSTPKPVLPESYAGVNRDFNAPGAPQSQMTSNPDWHWWEQFHDDELNALEKKAASGNLDLQVALLRIVAARSQVQMARAQGLPSVNAKASAEREQLGLAGILKSKGSSPLTSSPEAQGLLSSLEQPITLYQVGFDASWELDLFGKVTRSVEAANAQSDEAVESANDALVSLEAEVAQTYFQLRAAQMLRAITLEVLSDQKEILELTKNRQSSGLSNQSAVESAQAQLSNAEAQLPQYDATIAASSHALAVLTGDMPTALEAELQPEGVLPALPSMVAVGVPSTLARRRPDIRQAEAQLHAATAEIGVSVASMYPDVSLSGTFGVRNTTPKYLFNWASRFYTFGPSVSLPIFEGGSLIAQVKVSRAEAAEAALNYRKTVLSALQEIEDGLTILHDDGLKVGSLEQSVAANQRSVDLALQSYRIGLSSYIEVLNAESQTISAKQQYDSALLSESTDLVKLFKALGGGWQNAPDQDGEPLPPVGTMGTGGLSAGTPSDLAPR